MSSNEINWDNEYFSSISKEKLDIIKKIAKEVDGLTPEAALAYWAKINKQLISDKISFNNKEKEIIINILEKNLTKQDKSKLTLLRSLLSK